jgi:hypothetical protein
MAIRAVVFDIGGVLEIDPDIGVVPMWEARLGLPAGELSERMRRPFPAQRPGHRGHREAAGQPRVARTRLLD